MKKIPGLGIDIHAAFYQVCVIDEDGVVEDHRIETGEEGVARLIGLVKSMAVLPVIALEACTGSYYLHDQLKVTGATILIIDPRKLRERFPKRGKKTDKVDAKNLATLARFHDVDANWIPPEGTRRLRELTQERCRVTDHCTIEMNRVHAKLKEHGIKWKGRSKALWTEAGRKWLENRMTEAPLFIRLTVKATLNRLDVLWRQKKELELMISEEVGCSEECRLLMTLPGVSLVGAAIILAEVGDWRRFESSKQLVSYAGLNPRVHQSGNVCQRGAISKRGRRTLRWICVELALSAHKNCPILGAFYNRIAKRTRCASKAKVAVGRKLLALCWHILRSGVPYSHENQKLSQRKQINLRRMVGQARRLRAGGKPPAPPEPSDINERGKGITPGPSLEVNSGRSTGNLDELLLAPAPIRGLTAGAENGDLGSRSEPPSGPI